MRLLRIRLENLSSLYGEHVVDIEGELGGAPLFLIHGPTGAGKSTLMDAVSLALFGQTPRLTRSRGEPDADARNVMSRGTGFSSAQVEILKLEGGRPVRYRATWQCQRAHKRPEGAPREPKRTLERKEQDAEWVTVASDTREKFYREAFDRMLEGLTIDDFKRTMLLAQGEFVAFLKASEDERASILERLTDTALYRELGQRAHGRWQEAKEALRLAEQELQGVALLGAEEERALRLEEAAARSKIDELKEELRSLAARLSWVQRLAELRERERAAVSGEEEARQAWEARAPELDRLAQHERCSGAAGNLTDVERLRQEAERLAARLPELEAQERHFGEELERLRSRREALEAERTAKAEALSRAAPEIAEARRLRLELAGARAEREAASKAGAERSRLAAEAQARFEETERVWLRASEAVRHAEEDLAAREAARPLVEALAGLAARHDALVASRAAASQKEERRRQERIAIEAEAADLVGRRSRLSELEARARELEGASNSAAGRLASALAGAADPRARRQALTAKREDLRTRLEAVGEVRRLSAERGKREVELEGVLAQEREQGVLLERGRSELAGEAEGRERSRQRLAELRQELDDLRWMQRVARERGRLTPGKECPLCGSPEHPHVRDGRFAEIDARTAARCTALEAEISTRERELDAQEARLRDIGQKLAAGEALLAALRSKAEELRSGAEENEAALAAASERAGLEGPSSLEALAAALEAERSQLAVLEQELDDAQALAAGAERAAAGAREALRLAERDLRGSEEALAARTTRLSELEAQLAAEISRCESAEAELTGELAARGVQATPELATALSVAARRVEELKQAELSRAEAERQLQAAGATLTEARAAHEAASAQARLADEELHRRTEVVTALEPAAAEALGGRDPEQVERELGDARERAEASLESAREAAQSLAQRLTQASTELKAQKARLEETGKSLAELEARLASQLRALGLSDEPALRARLLSEPDRAQLAAFRAQLERELESARARCAERRGDLERHLAGTPPEYDEAVDTCEALSSRAAEREASLEELRHRQAELKQKLRVQEQARERHEQKQRVFEERRRELAVWDRLHGLIGVRDGEAFRRFAQILNLAELMERANHQLARLAPRYALVGARDEDGESRLAFAVRDAFHAGEVRPITTLSGGETFLVSLALALALAGYRTLRMPIETLLLDEGFGTLDPETLQVAMGALEALNASGTQVGIISHVEGLKEKIPARVCLERAGNGRSVIRVENAWPGAESGTCRSAPATDGSPGGAARAILAR